MVVLVRWVEGWGWPFSFSGWWGGGSRGGEEEEEIDEYEASAAGAAIDEKGRRGRKRGMVRRR